MNLKTRNRQVQLELGKKALARSHAEDYLAGYRKKYGMSFRDIKAAQRMRREALQEVTVFPSMVTYMTYIIIPALLTLSIMIPMLLAAS